MENTTVIDPGDHTADELLSGLQDGERFVVRTEVLGSVNNPDHKGRGFFMVPSDYR